MGTGGWLGSIDENASRNAMDDFDLKIFCIPLRQDDLADLSLAELGVNAGEKSVPTVELFRCDTGDSVEAVDRPGVFVRYDAGVGGNGGGSD